MKFKGKKLEKWQTRRLFVNLFVYLGVMIIFLSVTTTLLVQDRQNEDNYWDSSLTESEDMAQEVSSRSGQATKVTVGTYIENLKEISLKSSYYRLVAQVWFKWEGNPELDMKNNFRVYKGLVNKSEVIKEYREGNTNYQLIRSDITVTKDYWTCRFPLESHQLRMYIVSNLPVEQVVIVNDKENSGMNKNLTISGFEVSRHDTAAVSIKQDGTHGDPELKDDLIISEHLTAIELNRQSPGLYAKCFIALVGTITWVMIALFLNSYHHVDPLGMIPAALFGTVTNIMVGANLLPDALQIGLLEYVNIFGIMTILSVTLSIININRIRNKHENREFASFVGKVMFATILIVTATGNLLLPLSAFMFS